MSTTQAQWLDRVGSVLKTLNEGVIISDEDRRIVFANSTFLEMGKMPAEHILGRSVMDLYPPEDLGKVRAFIARREAQGRAQYEFYIAQADGGRLPVAVTSRLVHGGDGRAYGIITATDISEQKRAQKELSEKNALLLERQQHMQQELLLAERVQQSLAPKGPMAAVRLHRARGCLQFAGAGHPPAIIVRPGQSPRLLESTNMILGLFENAVDTDSSVETVLQRGDRVAIYTDGLTETFNSRREMLGIDGLQEIVAEASSLPLVEMKQQILDRVAAWRDGDAGDDVSLVLLEIS